jgi:hypothetical protein
MKFTILECYASVCSCLLTFRSSLSVIFSRVKQSKKMGPICCPETSVNNYQSTLRNKPEERISPLHRGGGLGCIVVLNAHAPADNKSDD